MSALNLQRLHLRHIIVLLSALVALAWANVANAQPSFPELNNSPVVDEAGIIDTATEEQLVRQLLEFEQRNQRQFVIVTLDSLQGYDIADYGYQLGRAWGIGDAERNDGILLIVAPNEKKMRIEVGYGLEAVIPDGLAFEYIEGMKPYFRNGDFSGGISWAADQIITQLELPPEEAAAIAQQAGQQRSSGGGFPIGTVIWLGFLFFFFVLPMIGGKGRRYRRRGVGGVVGDIVLWEAGKAIARGASGGGSSWGGGGFGGGGFSGGGGSFGGGGASGGW